MINSSVQHTLNEEIEFSGVGLHTGHNCTMIVKPAGDDHGYKFERRDLEGAPIIEASTSNVSSTQRSTTLSKGGAEVHTSEHILAALYASGIDSALISLDGPEIPIMDGSAQMFLDEIKRVGAKELSAKRKFYKFRKNISFEDADREIEMMVVPSNGEDFKITVMVDYNSPILGTQHARLDGLVDFESEIASCRTFVFMKEVAALAANGLIKGGDVDNSVVLAERPYTEDELSIIGKNIGREKINVLPNKTGVVSASELRFPNEPARHKLLDILGDIALTGRYLHSHILAARPGHYSNVEFAKLMSDTIKNTEGLPDLRTDREPILNINDISKLLPHRYPFLLVDSVLEMTENSITGIKNVTMNEPFFQGHFPENPVMPGVLQVEAMAQVGGVFALSSVDEPEYWSTYFMKIDDVRFKQKVLPGDTIVFHLELISPIRRGLVHMQGKGYVRGKLVSQANLLAQIIKDRAPEDK